MSALECGEAVLAIAEHPGYRPDVRGLAARTGISLDQIHITLQELLRNGSLRMVSRVHWQVERQA